MNEDENPVPGSEPTPNRLTPEEVNAIFESLRAFKAECRGLGLNRNDLAAMMINACIVEGFDAGKRITGALEQLGFNKQHAGKILSDGTGDDPQRHRWQRHADGRYTIHEECPSI